MHMFHYDKKFAICEQDVEEYKFIRLSVNEQEVTETIHLFITLSNELKTMLLNSFQIITVERYNEIKNFAQSFVYGKLTDDETPNYDLIKSFIELQSLFGQ